MFSFIAKGKQPQPEPAIFQSNHSQFQLPLGSSPWSPGRLVGCRKYSLFRVEAAFAYGAKAFALRISV
jgi:hypothetical protein